MAQREVRRKFSCDDLPKRCFASFDEMRNESQLCDITFRVGEVSISAHRVILAAAIPYFRKIFSQGIDQVPDIESDTLACLVDYAYAREVNIDTANVESLLSVACHLGIGEIKDACCDFLSDDLEPETAWNVRNLAIKFNCPTLLEDVDCYIREKFNAVSQTRDFLNYPVTYLKELIDNDDLNIENEKVALDVVLRWVKEAPEDRKNDLPELLCTIRLPLIEPRCLVTTVESEELIRASLTCRDLIDEAKHYNLLPDVRKAVCSFKIFPRRNRKQEYVSHEKIENPCIYKLTKSEVYAVQCFNFSQKKWMTEEPKTFAAYGGSAVHVQNKMYFFRLGTTVQYDPKGRSFKWMNGMPTYRLFCGATAVKNKIYICGGRTNSDKATNVVECFDPAEEKWETIKSLPTSRWGLSAVTLGEYIFAIGGKCNGRLLDTVEKYNPNQDRWTSMSSMLVKRYLAGTSTMNGKIYVCGGDTSTGAVSTGEVYDPTDDHWVLISPLTSARYDFVLLSSQGKLYAAGGRNREHKQIHTFDIYDPEKDEWKCGASTDSKFYASGAVVMAAIDA